MKLKKYLLLLTLFPTICFSQLTGEATVKDPSALIAQINAFSQKTSSITADFTQVKDMSFMQEKITSTGRFYFQKEKVMRWEYTTPFAYAIILNGDRIRIIDEGKIKDFDASSNRMFLEISDIMTGMVNGTLLNSTEFLANWFDAPGYYRAELLPTSEIMQDYLSKIEIKLNKSDYSVEELKMFEKSGDYTLINFKNKKLNETIPADIFRLD
jgi:outer membrane lipoprotein-sorting protein